MVASNPGQGARIFTEIFYFVTAINWLMECNWCHSLWTCWEWIPCIEEQLFYRDSEEETGFAGKGKEEECG